MRRIELLFTAALAALFALGCVESKDAGGPAYIPPADGTVPTAELRPSIPEKYRIPEGDEESAEATEESEESTEEAAAPSGAPPFASIPEEFRIPEPGEVEPEEEEAPIESNEASAEEKDGAEGN